MKSFPFFSSCFLAAGLAFASSAHADLSYVQTTSTAFGGGLGNTNVKYFSKGQKQRIETNVMGSKNVTLSQCGNLASTLIDTKNRIYTTYPNGLKSPKRQGRTGIPKDMSMSFKVKNLGTGSINSQKAPHYRIDMTMKMNGRPMNLTTEIWSSNTPMPSCPGMDKEVVEQLTRNMGMFRGSNIKINGDLKSLAKIYRMVPLQQKISMRGSEFATVKTVKLSTAPLSSSLFGVPAGYQKVSNEKYQSIQQQAMRAKMGDIFKSMPKMGSMSN